tara:strand:+ start:235 stop:2067 length:1833 start_codon:yes stop_codon:yes gene_type:complete
MKLCYDIETDGFDANVIWCIVAQNMETGVVYKYSDHDDKLPSIKDGVQILSNAEVLIGHNIIGFDNVQVDKLYGTDLNSKKCYDTWVMSQVLRYRRTHKQGLAGWGEHLNSSKIHYDDWSSYNREMLRYCVQDVKLNVLVYNKLLQEFSDIKETYPLISKGLEIEHDSAKFNVLAREKGWKFDIETAHTNLKIMEEKMNTICSTIEPEMGDYKKYIDKEPKTPKYKKNGDYTIVTARILSEFLGYSVKCEDTHVMAAGTEFQRFTVNNVTLGQLDLVKEWLLTKKGWKPDEFTKKRLPDGSWITSGPKLTTTSLLKLGEVGEMIDDYYTLRNRTSVIRGWLEQVKSGRIHGNMWVIGTPTFRARHEVIVNLPSITAKYGKELRELFVADDNMVIVGADSSGNQLRALCHYVDNDTFTHEVCFGDQHQRNADSLGCTRGIAKNYLYAYLFGAGDGKLGQVLTGKTNVKVGKESRVKFSKGIKGLEDLRKSIGRRWNNTYHSQGAGWFPALDGRPVFPTTEHQCLNYLLQTTEGITCKAALSYSMRKIKEEGLTAEPRLFYHDELAYVASKEDAKRVGEILQESFREAPKMFGVTCMDGGDYVIGSSYADVH